MDTAFWQGRRVVVTGHTGFKGAWLAEWLLQAGAAITGIALEPATDPNLYELLGLRNRIDSHILDIRNRAALERVMPETAPEIVLHLAGQALVRQAYADPIGTYETNVMGTANVLESVRNAPSVRAVVVVTTDKCYANRESIWAFREDEPLGGNDPYSSSKASAELVAHAYARSFFQEGPGIATARAGNVIGGGDWSKDRLVPDVVRAAVANSDVELRNPNATRPWQHVLEPLSGYLLLAQRVYSDPQKFAQPWNFGPLALNRPTVAQLTLALLSRLDRAERWKGQPGEHPHEAQNLSVDSTKARTLLGWRSRLNEEETIDWTAQWYRAWHAGEDVRKITVAQIEEYAAR
jgi:CDP-glucose 4,6-dehydratase